MQKVRFKVCNKSWIVWTFIEAINKEKWNLILSLTNDRRKFCWYFNIFENGAFYVYINKCAQPFTFTCAFVSLYTALVVRCKNKNKQMPYSRKKTFIVTLPFYKITRYVIKAYNILNTKSSAVNIFIGLSSNHKCI